jgi:hypothetical protein
MHVEYAIHRHGEWTMLMLGESVLSLLIVDVVDSQDYYGVFFAGVMSIIFLQYVHFRSQPHDPDEHAMRRNRNSAMLVNFSSQIYSIALVVLGAAYKMFLYEVVHASHSSSSGGRFRLLGDVMSRWLTSTDGGSSLPTAVRQQNIAHLFSGSMAIVWLCLDVMILAHKGIGANVHRAVACTLVWRATTLLFVLVRLGLIVFFATLSQYETRPTRLAAIGCAGVVLQFVSRAVGSVVFPNRDDNEPEEVFELESDGELVVAPE